MTMGCSFGWSVVLGKYVLVLVQVLVFYFISSCAFVHFRGHQSILYLPYLFYIYSPNCRYKQPK